MTVYYVDDGGSDTSPYDTWAKAATSIRVLDTAVALASGDVVYFGHDSVDAGASGFTIVGPSSGAPVQFVSATSGSSPPAYQQATADQIVCTGILTFDGSFALHGLKISSAYSTALTADANETMFAEETTFVLGSTWYLTFTGNAAVLNDCVIDISSDSFATTSNVFSSLPSRLEINGLTFNGGSNRTGEIFPSSGGVLRVHGADFSGFTNATLCELSKTYDADVLFCNCKTADTWGLASTTARPNHVVTAINTGPAHDPTAFRQETYFGTVVSSASIYRTGGAQFDEDETAWLVTTTPVCTEGSPYYLPWMIGTVEAGSRTFTVHIVNDTADFEDDEVWLEVHYLGTSGSALSSRASDQRASVTATPAAQTDDTASTWNGTGPSFTYKQTLSVTATVGQAGQYRARVVVGKPSIAGSSYFYIDPVVVLS